MIPVIQTIEFDFNNEYVSYFKRLDLPFQPTKEIDYHLDVALEDYYNPKNLWWEPGLGRLVIDFGINHLVISPEELDKVFLAGGWTKGSYDPKE